MRKIFQILYSVIGCRTPESWRKFRNYLVKGYISAGGENLSIGRKAKIHKNTIIGNNSGVGYRCEINNGVTIGDNVMMGPNVIIFTQNHSTSKTDVPMRLQGMEPVRPVCICDDVWIGARVCILPGVTIGEGAVIGACTVVTKDVPSYTVAVGNPMRFAKDRRLD